MFTLLSLLLLSNSAAPARAGAVWTIVVPFGAGEFTHGEPLRGAVYATAQVGLAGLATWSTLVMREAAITQDFETELRHRFVSAGAVAGFSVVWVTQIIDGSRLHAMELDDGLGLASRGGLPVYLQAPGLAQGSALTPPALNLSQGFSVTGAWPAYSLENQLLNSRP